MKQHTNNKEQLNRKEYKNALKRFQRLTVHTQLNKDSKQLSTPLPKIAEKTLPRTARIRLAQLRTGYCPLLNSYLSRICDNVYNLSPKCDVNHIFNCSKNTTDLKVVFHGPVGKTSRGSQMAGLKTISPTLHGIIRLPSPFPPMLTMPLLGPTRGPHVVHHGVDAEKSPHYKQVVDRQSHTTTNISIFVMIQMQLGYPLKTTINAGFSPKFPANCSSVRQLQQQQRLLSLLSPQRSINVFRTYKSTSNFRTYNNALKK